MTALASRWVEFFGLLFAHGAGFPEAGSFIRRQDAAAHKTAVDVVQNLYELHRKKATPDTADATESSRSFEHSFRLSCDPRLEAAELYEMLRNQQVALTFRPAASGIVVAEPRRVRGLRFDTVILGDTDCLSSQAIDSVGSRLRESFGIATISDEDAVTRARLYELLATAERRLVVLAQTEDSGGRILPPPVFLESLAALLVDKQGRPCLFDDEGKALFTPTRQSGFVESIVSQSFSDADKTQDMQALLAGKSLPGPLLPPHGRAARYDLGVAADASFSPTALEAYAACPFGWFLKRYIPSTSYKEKYTAADLGSFAHKVLCCFYKDFVQQQQQPRVNVAYLAQAQACLHQHFVQCLDEEQTQRALTPADRFNLELLAASLQSLIEADSQFAPGYAPQDFEVSFGLQGEPAVEVGDGLKIHGVIDRIDRAADGRMIVTDYKLKHLPAGLKSQANKQVFQGTLYRYAAEQLFGGCAFAQVYRSIKDPTDVQWAFMKELDTEAVLGTPTKTGTRSGASKAETFAKLSEHIVQEATQAAQAISAGYLRLADTQPPECYCPYEDLCPRHKEKTTTQ
jgi:RecB family exonuclease